MSRRVSPASGFTIVEMLTAMAIIAVLAGLSVVAMNRLKARGNFSSATGDFIGALRAARAEAFARGDNTVMVVDISGQQWWTIEDVAGTFTLTGFVPSAPVWPTGDRLISSGVLPNSVIFGPANGWGTALPAPFSGIPTGFVNLPDGGVANITADGGSSSPNFNYCSFCDPGTKLGAITFLPSGGALFSGGPLTMGQQIAMQDIGGGPSDGGITFGIIDFAVVGATGSAEAVTVQ
jgi:prepilin-type N-terminal cleavage/methylation domain-containing protein